jgi:hypothetical protein
METNDIIKKYLSDLGKKGGASKSEKKQRASRENGKKYGGRPLGSKNKKVSK